MFVLTETERIAILCGCIGLLGIVIVLTVCFVCPVCWFYRLLNRRKIEDAEMKCYRDYFSGSLLDRDPPPPYEPSTKNFFDLKSPLDFSRRLTSQSSVSTVCSDTDSVTGIPLPLIEDTEIPASEIQESSSFDPGNVSITLQFKRITGEDKKVFSQLRVDMKEAADIPLRTYGGKCDPYFIIGLFDKSINRRKKKKPEPSPLYQFHTTVCKRSQHPIYNESFFFPLEQKQVKKTVLKIEAWDKDKWANDTALGEVYFNLKDVASILLQQPSKELDLNLKLEDSKKINGQLLLGLCYLPTAERMTVAVLKANNLRTDKNDISDYYVQAMATYGGKVFERRKTSTQPSSSFPVFNEMLMFDVPFAKLDDVVLLLTLRGKASKDTDSYQSDTDAYQKTTKDECIGKLVIGSYSRKNTLNHWNAVKNSPRRQIIQWHELR